MSALPIEIAIEHRDREQGAADDRDPPRVPEQRRLAGAGERSGAVGVRGAIGHGSARYRRARRSRHRASRSPSRARGGWHVWSGAADPDNPAGTLVGMAGSTVADLVGRVLAGRYRLLGAIGSGASGRVYVADDVRLRRRVAVKVLHAALADDSGFLRRFRSEAQLAASLHHPNVMAVYDWGEDGVPFMVLELLAGGSLRSMLDAGNRLSPVAGRARRRPGRRRARLRARPRPRPPRHQAREPPLRRARHRARRRLRARPRARRGELDRAGRRGRRHRALRRAGAGLGRAARRSRRPLRARPRDGRVGHRLGAARRRHAARHDRTAPGARDRGRPPSVGALAPVARRARASASPDDAVPDAPTRCAPRSTRWPSACRRRDRSCSPASARSARTRTRPRWCGRSASCRCSTRTSREACRVATRPASVARVARTRSRSAAPFLLGAVITVLIAAAAFVLARPNVGPDGHRPAPRRPVARERAADRARHRSLLVDSTYRDVRRPAGHGHRAGPAAGWLPRRADVRCTSCSRRGRSRSRSRRCAGKTQEAATQALAGAVRRAGRRARRRQGRAEGHRSSRSDPPGTAPPDSAVQLIVSSGPPLVVVPDVSGRELRRGRRRGCKDRGLRRGARRRVQRHRPGRTRSSAPTREAGTKAPRGLRGHGRA